MAQPGIQRYDLFHRKYHVHLLSLEIDEPVGAQGTIEHSPAPQSPLAPLIPAVTAHSGWTIRLPARYINYLPVEDSGLWQAPPKPPSPSPSPQPLAHGPGENNDRAVYQTEPDTMGLVRIYLMEPSFIPDADVTLTEVADASTLMQVSQPSSRLCNIIPPSDIT